MTKGQQRQFGGVEAEVVTSGELVVTGEGLPAVDLTVPTFEGWGVDDLLVWIREEAFKVEAAEGWVEANRLALGAALHLLRDLVGEGDYGGMLKDLALSAGVSTRTLQRWRAMFEKKTELPPPKKAAKRVASRRGRGQKPPELTTGVVSGDEGSAGAPVSAGETPPPSSVPPAENEPPAPSQAPPVEQEAPPPPAAPTPAGKDEQVHAIFDRFFTSDPRAVAEMSDVKDGKARAKIARIWVDAYEMAVKGVAPLAPVTPLRGKSPAPLERSQVTPNFKGAKK